MEYLNVIGLMTGTSMDGIDICLVRTNGQDLVRLDKNYYYRYSFDIKNKLINALNKKPSFNLKQDRVLVDLITNEHYVALKNLDIVEQCDLIGFHGQTIYHNPINKTSIQLGCPKKLAKMLKKNIVYDFRSNDISLGGQGAPLAPIYHQFLIQKLNLELPACIINIGGVCNLTYWDGKTLIGFDTGPGNALMDDLMLTKYKKNFDVNGRIASEGNPIKQEIETFLQNEFFKKSPPKSLDRLSFKSQYDSILKKKYSVHDIMATFAEFTVESIVASLKILPTKINSVLIAGGGYRNIHLMKRLRNRLKTKILYEKQTNMNFDYIEAELIAYLSARSIYKLPFTFPSTTGVSKPSSGGKLYKYL